jgi:hypothetical protein
VASRINPIPLFALIICVIFTLVFAIAVFAKNGQIKDIEEGSNSIAALTKKVREKRLTIAGLEQDIKERQQVLYRLDLQADALRLYYGDEELKASVATADETGGTVDGKQVQWKQSTWKMVSDEVALSAKYLDSLHTEYASDERQKFPHIEEAIASRHSELKDVIKKIADQDAAFQADRDRLQAQLEQLTAEKDKNEKKMKEDASRRLTRINQLEDRIRELLELDLHWLIDRDKDGKVIGKAGLLPDGNVLRVDAALRRVVIDRGAKDKLFPGLRFEVFNFDHGGYLSKGMIEVIEVDQEIATCRLLRQDDEVHQPIGPGDYIGNPVFNSKRPKVFVVAGEFKHYDKADLETFIRRTGGVVADTLGPGCDYLVAGDRSDRQQADARQYQILAMREEDLLDYVQTTFAPTSGTDATAPAAAAPAAGGDANPPPPAAADAPK